MGSFSFWPSVLGPRQAGNTPLIFAMLVTAGLGAVVYKNAQKLSLTQKSVKEEAKRDAAEKNNMSSFALAQSLFAYNITSSAEQRVGPKSTQLEVFNTYYSRLPVLYPGSDKLISPLKGSVSEPGLWQFNYPNLSVCPPDKSCASVSDMDKIEFLSQTDASRWDVKATSTIKDPKDGTSKTLSQRAQLTMDTKYVVGCHVRERSGRTAFAPNENVQLEVEVYGLVDDMQFAMDNSGAPWDRDIATNIGDYSYTIAVDTSSKRSRNRLYYFEKTTDRPLQAVDGGQAAYQAAVYLRPKGGQAATVPDCTFAYTISSPASCKVWPSATNVLPGSTVTLGYAYIGTAKNFRAKAYRENQKNAVDKVLLSGLTNTNGIWTFKVPNGTEEATADSNYFWPYRIQVSSTDASKIDPIIKGLSPQQRMDLMHLLVTHTRSLANLLGSNDALYAKAESALSIYQATNLARSFGSTLANPADFDFSDIQGAAFNNKQIEELRKLSTSDMTKLPQTVTEAVDSLASVPDATMDVLRKANPLALGTLLDNNLVNAADKTALNSLAFDNIVIEGQVDNINPNGAVKPCITQVQPVQSLANTCRFFGPSYPNYGEVLRLWIYWNGWGYGDIMFYPRLNNYEVDAIAQSPTVTDPCPDGARCFALGDYYPRTPFVIIYNANSPSCYAYMLNRIYLGCFAADTKIRMADGTDKVIHELKDGEQVWNPARKKAFAIRRVIAGPEHEPLVSVSTAQHSVRVTTKHPMITQRGMITARELKPDDQVMIEGGLEAITSLRNEGTKPKDPVFNFELVTDSEAPEDHMVLADGIVTGDLKMQERLERSQQLSQDLDKLKP